jgi:hypothetical protein
MRVSTWCSCKRYGWAERYGARTLVYCGRYARLYSCEVALFLARMSADVALHSVVQYVSRGEALGETFCLNCPRIYSCRTIEYTVFATIDRCELACSPARLTRTRTASPSICSACLTTTAQRFAQNTRSLPLHTRLPSDDPVGDQAAADRKRARQPRRYAQVSRTEPEATS